MIVEITGHSLNSYFESPTEGCIKISAFLGKVFSIIFVQLWAHLAGTNDY